EARIEATARTPPRMIDARQLLSVSRFPPWAGNLASAGTGRSTDSVACDRNCCQRPCLALAAHDRGGHKPGEVLPPSPRWGSRDGYTRATPQQVPRLTFRTGHGPDPEGMSGASPCF